MKLIKDILSQMGFIDSLQCSQIAKHFPNTRIVIKWGSMPRERVRAFEVADRIKKVEEDGVDYARHCFISSKEYEMLKEVFGIVQ
jgi:predicted TIM-barrel fold metal-dependent hydrolase